MTKSEDGKIKMLKGTVFLMTFMLIVGVCFMIYGLTAGTKERPAPAAAGQPASVSQVRQMVPCGSMLCVHAVQNGEDEIIILDPQNGKVQHRFGFPGKES